MAKNAKMVVYGFTRDSRGIKKVLDPKTDRFVLYGDTAGVTAAKYSAKKMDVEEVWLVDTRVGLKDEYLEAQTKNTMEQWVEFYDTICRDGIRIK